MSRQDAAHAETALPGWQARNGESEKHHLTEREKRHRGIHALAKRVGARCACLKQHPGQRSCATDLRAARRLLIRGGADRLPAHPAALEPPARYSQPVEAWLAARLPIRRFIVLRLQSRPHQAIKTVLRRIHYNPQVSRPRNHVACSRMPHPHKTPVPGIDIQRTGIRIPVSRARINRVHHVRAIRGIVQGRHLLEGHIHNRPPLLCSQQSRRFFRPHFGYPLRFRGHATQQQHDNRQAA